MRELRWRKTRRFKDQDMLKSIREMVLAADDVANAKVGVIRARGQVIGRHAIGTQQGEVLDVGSGLQLLAVDRVAEADRLTALPRDAETQSKRLSGIGTAVTFFAGQLAHTRIEQPRPLRSRFFAFARVGRGEIAVSEASLKDSFRHLPVQSSTVGLLVILVPAQAQPLKSFKNRIHGGIGIALNVSIVEAENHRAAGTPGIQPVEDEGARAADVKESGGGRRKT